MAGSKKNNGRRRGKAQKQIERQVASTVRRMTAGQKVALVVSILVVAACAALIWYFVIRPLYDKPLSPADGQLTVHFIDVGQGDSIYIELPDGKNMLIDGGDNKTAVENALCTYLHSRMGTDLKIEYLVLTHTDSDHVGGLDRVLDEFEIANVYMPKITTEQITTKVYAAFVRAVEDENARVIYNGDDSDIDGGNYLFDFFCADEEFFSKINDKSSAEKKNAQSPFIFLTYAGVKILFTGDATEGKDSEQLLLDKISGSELKYDVDVLKVGHHGSETSTSAEFLQAVKPEYAVIECGEGNKYDHPRQQTLDRLRQYVKADGLYRTDLNGNVVLTVGDNGSTSFVCEKTPERPEDNFNGFAHAMGSVNALYYAIGKMRLAA